VAAALLITAAWVALSPDFGVTWDERSRHAYGIRVVGYLKGELPQSSFDTDGARLYAGLFDATAAALHQWLGGDLWTLRHRLNAVFGGVGLLATGLVALRLFGARAGLLAVLLLALSPRYVGDSMNNPKDLPFAACFAVILLSFTLIRPVFPFLTWRRTIAVGVAIALAFNVRPGAVLFLGFFWMLVGALTLWRRAWSPRQLLHTAGLTLIVTLVALVLGTALWPWAQANPLVRRLQALMEGSQIGYDGTMLFLGRDTSAQRPPMSYIPVWIAVTTPLAVLAGLGLALWRTIQAPEHRPTYLALWTLALLPIVLVIVRHSTLYDGWRHLLFVYPPLVVLAAGGWAAALAVARQPPRARLAVGLVLFAGLAEPLVYMIRSHPHDIVYFNPIVGGPRGALGRFELDYWANSFGEAGRWCDALARRAGVTLVVAGHPRGVSLAELSRNKALRAKPWALRQHQLEVVLLRGSRQEVESTLMRLDALHVVRTGDGTPLSMVFPGPRFKEVADRLAPYLGPREPVLLEDH
jgi:4-amino-4-deoxy-L-arabinose transferase-like glycosyltransferase